MSNTEKMDRYKELEYEANKDFIKSVVLNLSYPLDPKHMESFNNKFERLTEADKESIFIDSFDESTDYDSQYDMSWFEFFSKKLGIKDTYDCFLEMDTNQTIFSILFDKAYMRPTASLQVIDWIIDNIPEMKKEYKNLILNTFFGIELKNDYKEKTKFNHVLYKAYKNDFFKNYEDLFITEIIKRKYYQSNKDDFFDIEFFSKEIQLFPEFEKILYKDCAAKEIIKTYTDVYLNISDVESQKSSDKDFQSLNIEPGYTMAPSKGHRSLISLERLIDFLENKHPSHLINSKDLTTKIDLLYKSFIIEHRMQIASDKNMNDESLNYTYPRTDKIISLCGVSSQTQLIKDAFKEKYQLRNSSMDDTIVIKNIEKIEQMVKHSILLNKEQEQEQKSKLKI